MRMIGIVVLAATLASGCSLVGYGFGAGIDGMNVERAPADSVSRFPVGTKVKVVLADSSVVRGRFAGLDTPAGAPRTLRLAVQSGTEPLRVPLDSVVRIERKPKGGRVAGVALGGALDGLFIVAMVVCAAKGGIMYC